MRKYCKFNDFNNTSWRASEVLYNVYSKAKLRYKRSGASPIYHGSSKGLRDTDSLSFFLLKNEKNVTFLFRLTFDFSSFSLTEEI